MIALSFSRSVTSHNLFSLLRIEYILLLRQKEMFYVKRKKYFQCRLVSDIIWLENEYVPSFLFKERIYGLI